jgi:hypothetical protein
MSLIGESGVERNRCNRRICISQRAYCPGNPATLGEFESAESVVRAKHAGEKKRAGIYRSRDFRDRNRLQALELDVLACLRKPRRRRISLFP